MEDYVVIGRIGRAHGIRGEVSVEPRTDEPERRFRPGAVLRTQSARGAEGQPMTVESVRWHSGRLLLRFEGMADRTAAEAARGTVLVVPIDPEETPEDPEEFYDHQLVGLRVEDAAGTRLGTVAGVVHGGGQDLLRLDVDGREVLFPFVAALVPTVDVPGGRVVIEDRPGLLSEPGES